MHTLHPHPHINTFESEDGFTPSSFTSSRTKRSEVKRLKLEDYLDKEDYEEMGDQLIEVVGITDNKIGCQLLKLVGWRDVGDENVLAPISSNFDQKKMPESLHQEKKVEKKQSEHPKKEIKDDVFEPITERDRKNLSESLKKTFRESGVPLTGNLSFQPQSIPPPISSHPTSTFLNTKRQVVEWIPDILLCKRLNIPDPFISKRSLFVKTGYSNLLSSGITNNTVMAYRIDGPLLEREKQKHQGDRYYQNKN